jgi:hypothetical protein
MRRRSLLCGTAGLIGNEFLPMRLVLAANGVRDLGETDSWPPQVYEFVRSYQEREYNRLADRLGLASAKAAYERLSQRPMPPDLEQRYRTAGLPTPYEDPYLYQAMKKTFDLMRREADAQGPPALPRPFLATLVSGDVNARIALEEKTKTTVLFFERGLFSFFYDMAKLTAWASPPLSVAQLADDSALSNIPRKYTMPPQASAYFAASLYAYAVSGSPIATSSPIPEPSHNMPLAIVLLNHMERFVMAHELAHIRNDHLNKPPMPAQEFEADALGVSLVTALARANHGSWGIGYWASELALIAFNFLYRTIGLLMFGPAKLTWTSQTHPDPLSRRENLRGIWLNRQVPANGVAAARELCGMTEALFQRLWELGLTVLVTGYQRGDRTSLVWRKALEMMQAK